MEDVPIAAPQQSSFHEGRHRLSIAHLLIALVGMFVIAPFADAIPFGRLTEAMIFTAVLLFAMNAIGRRRRTLIVAALLVSPALLTRWIDHVYPGLLPAWPSLVAVVVFVAFVIWHLLRFVMSTPKVTSEVLCAAISIYLLFAVAWAYLYTLLAATHPDAFKFTVEGGQGEIRGFTAIYFSAEILTALAFGDIVPVSNVARMMTLVEATCAVFYVTILIARLVAVYSRPNSQQAADHERS
jgi:hypothetical protein